MSEVNKVLEIFNKNYNRQVILYGPPGTSKTYSSTLIAANFLQNKIGSEVDLNIEEANKYLKDECQKGHFELIQFHPSYNYEDFVRGIKVGIVNNMPDYKVVNRKFGEIAEKANIDWEKAIEDFIGGKVIEEKDYKNAAEYAEKNAKKYILVIDEINRAPVASVLGELIYGLEYRGQAISTPYAIDKKDEKLIIPKNLYIIGTMNTADRSIGSIDYAVRRRFAFVPLLSSKEVVINSWKGTGLGDYISEGEENKETFQNGSVARNVIELFEEVQRLFEKGNLADTSIQAEDIKIGHTYFLYDEEKCNSVENAKSYMRYRIEYQIVPIIEEYMKDGLLKEKDINKIREDLLKGFQ